MVDMPNDSWIETSKAEANLAMSITDIYLKKSREKELLQLLIYELVKCLLYKNSSCRDSMISQVLNDWPEIYKVQLNVPFPLNESSLSNNFFANLGYQINKKIIRTIDNGVVATPAILAKDMVRLAAVNYVLNNYPGINYISLCDWFFTGENTLTEVEKHNIQLLFKKARWYDPCIGGGVFPIVVAEFLLFIGIDKETIKKLIFGVDIDPISITVTKIRMALILNEDSEPFENTYESINNNFYVANALDNFTQQSTLFDVGNIYNQFEIVIGNPPYVRADRLSSEMKKTLDLKYPGVSGGAVDLYNYFIAHGLNSIHDNGVLCYISPAKFQKSKYGKKTREYIDSCATLNVLFDFHELPVFKNADLHSCVYSISKNKKNNSFKVYEFSFLPDSIPLYFGIKNSRDLPISNADVKGWNISSVNTRSIINLISEQSIPLINYVGNIYSGIKTGHKKAYYLTQEQVDGMNEDISNNYIKPLIRPQKIGKWKANWDESYILLIKKGEIVPEESMVYKHLLSYKAELEKRIDVKGHSTWYGLRECKYYEKFYEPKIIYPDISTECRFAIDKSGMIIPDGAFFLPTESYLLVAILNSCIGKYYFKEKCASIGNPKHGGRLRFKKTYVEQFPVRITTDKNRQLGEKIERLAKEMCDKEFISEDELICLDKLVLEFYNVPKSYWNEIMEG